MKAFSSTLLLLMSIQLLAGCMSGSGSSMSLYRLPESKQTANLEVSYLKNQHELTNVTLVISPTGQCKHKHFRLIQEGDPKVIGRTLKAKIPAGSDIILRVFGTTSKNYCGAPILFSPQPDHNYLLVYEHGERGCELSPLKVVEGSNGKNSFERIADARRPPDCKK